ncbi:hypothetical protein CH375_20265 [Leptospira ellisii]|nr:hypothetical protein CH375_20265 [Leptospira ellisii]
MIDNSQNDKISTKNVFYPNTKTEMNAKQAFFDDIHQRRAFQPKFENESFGPFIWKNDFSFDF